VFQSPAREKPLCNDIRQKSRIPRKTGFNRLLAKSPFATLAYLFWMEGQSLFQSPAREKPLCNPLLCRERGTSLEVSIACSRKAPLQPLRTCHEQGYPWSVSIACSRKAPLQRKGERALRQTCAGFNRLLAKSPFATALEDNDEPTTQEGFNRLLAKSPFATEVELPARVKAYYSFNRLLAKSPFATPSRSTRSRQ